MEFKTRRKRDGYARTSHPSPKVIHLFDCTHEDCEETFPTQNSLDMPLENVHDSWVPVPCDEDYT
jgi:hypothetical protein